MSLTLSRSLRSLSPHHTQALRTLSNIRTASIHTTAAAPARRHRHRQNMPPKAGYYAVSRGRKPGVYRTWAEAEAQVKGFNGAKHKKFTTESEAREWLAPDAGPYTGFIQTQTQTQTQTSAASSSHTAAASTPTASSSSDVRGVRGESPVAQADMAHLPPDLARLAAQGYTFSQSTPYRLVVYTDGSGLSNGQYGARAGAGVYWGSSGEAARHNLAERVPGPLQTNNRGELLSIIRALEECPLPDLSLEIRTDSQYSIKCMTEYVPKWIKNGWRTASGDVKNADMIRHLLVLLRRRGPHAPVRFKHVRGHVGHDGNEAADALARQGAAMPAVTDRRKWLNEHDEDEERETRRALSRAESPEVDVEVEEDWLMTADEMAELERELAE